jgi:hypothetical protein
VQPPVCGGNAVSLLAHKGPERVWGQGACSLRRASLPVACTCPDWRRRCRSEQGINWIKQREAAAGLVIVQQSQPKYIDKVIACIESGTPLLFENLPIDIDAGVCVCAVGRAACCAMRTRSRSAACARMGPASSTVL